MNPILAIKVVKAMKNKKTTVAGYLTLAGAGLVIIAQLINGEIPDIPMLMAAIAGLGLINARDGGH